MAVVMVIPRSYNRCNSLAFAVEPWNRRQYLAQQFLSEFHSSYC